MKCPTVLRLIVSLAPLLAAAGAEKTAVTVSLEYEGGTLALSQGKTKATISGETMVFSHGAQKVAVPLKSVTELSCSSDVHRRFGATVLGVFPHMHLATAEKNYIGLTLADSERASRIDAVLKLSNSDYRDVLTRLERLTGKKAVDTRQIPTVVKYGL